MTCRDGFVSRNGWHYHEAELGMQKAEQVQERNEADMISSGLVPFTVRF